MIVCSFVRSSSTVEGFPRIGIAGTGSEGMANEFALIRVISPIVTTVDGKISLEKFIITFI